MFGVIQTNNKTFIKKQRYVRIVGTISAFILLLLTFFAAFPVINKTMEAEAAPGTATASTSSITMTSGHTTANLNLVPHDSNGTFASSSSSELASFGVTTNNYTGYTLSIKASDNTKQLVNKDGNTTIGVLDSITSTISESTFNTTAYNGKWGYVPSRYNSADNTSFRPAPTTTASTLDATTTANPTTANNYTIGLGARVDYTKPAGSYTNTFILTAVGNPIAYTINYKDNTNDTTISGMPATDTGLSDSVNVRISNIVPTRTGYAFKSWCLGTVSDNGTTCTGTSYNASTTTTPSYIGIDQTVDNNTADLYATWTANTYTITLNGNGGTLGSTSTTATYDSATLATITNPTRANSTGSRTVSGFSIGSGADGASISSTSTLTSTNTTTYAFVGWYKEAAATNKIASNAATPVLVNNTSFTDANGKWTSTSAQTLYAGWTATAGSFSTVTMPTISKTGYTCGWRDQNNNPISSGAIITPSGNLTITGVCTVNSYYQTVQVRYQNASGGWGSYSTYSPCSVNVNYGSTHSCSIAASTEYQAAALSTYVVYGANTKYIDVYRKTFSVSVTAGSCISSVSGGGTVYYGGSVTISATAASNCYFVNWTGSGTYTSASQTINNITSNLSFTANGAPSCTSTFSGIMQNFALPSNLCSGAIGTLTDSRDNNTYSVRVINGTLWMIQNLRFKGASIDPANTNINAAKTLSYSELAGKTVSLTKAMYHDSGNTTDGVWYNYAAASAMTVTGSTNNNVNSSYSICPAGWKIPSKEDADSIIPYVADFNASTNGYYRDDGELINTGSGAWFTTTRYDNGYTHYSLDYGTYNGAHLYTITTYRNFGLNIRCIKS